MSETIYIETSVFGYLTARSTKNLIIAANIEITQDWWKNRLHDFIPYISKAVVNEVSLGDQEIASQRLDLLQDFPLLELTQAVRELGINFLNQSNLPPNAEIDAIHIATATVHNINYLLTWNCRHNANPQIQQKLRQISLNFGYQLPTICIPYEMLGD